MNEILLALVQRIQRADDLHAVFTIKDSNEMTNALTFLGIEKKESKQMALEDQAREIIKEAFDKVRTLGLRVDLDLSFLHGEYVSKITNLTEESLDFTPVNPKQPRSVFPDKKVNE